MTVLSKKEFVALVAEELKTTKTQAEATLDAVYNAIDRAVFEQKSGVKLGSIATLKVDVVPEREHSNPKTGEKVVKPQHYALKFKANAAFKRDLAEVQVEG